MKRYLFATGLPLLGLLLVFAGCDNRGKYTSPDLPVKVPPGGIKPRMAAEGPQAPAKDATPEKPEESAPSDKVPPEKKN